MPSFEEADVADEDVRVTIANNILLLGRVRTPDYTAWVKGFIAHHGHAPFRPGYLGKKGRTPLADVTNEVLGLGAGVSITPNADAAGASGKLDSHAQAFRRNLLFATPSPRAASTLSKMR